VRDVPSILDEWRALERELAEATDNAQRATIDARIDAVRAEHAAALDERSDQADALGSMVSLGTPAD
jgi:hypothetical protein